MALYKRANKTIWPFYSVRGLQMPNKLLYTYKIGLQCLRYFYFVKNWIWNLKCVCCSGSSEGPGKIVEAQT